MYGPICQFVRFLISGEAKLDQLWEEQRKFNESEMRKKGQGHLYDKYVCDDDAIKKALNGSFSIINGFKDKPSAIIEVPRTIKDESNTVCPLCSLF